MFPPRFPLKNCPREIYASIGRHHRCLIMFPPSVNPPPFPDNLFTVVTLCALLTRDLLAIAKFLAQCWAAPAVHYPQTSHINLHTRQWYSDRRKIGPTLRATGWQKVDVMVYMPFQVWSINGSVSRNMYSSHRVSCHLYILATSAWLLSSHRKARLYAMVWLFCLSVRFLVCC